MRRYRVLDHRVHVAGHQLYNGDPVPDDIVRRNRREVVRLVGAGGLVLVVVPPKRARQAS